jgi:membrane-bound ClpP family serine protease
VAEFFIPGGIVGTLGALMFVASLVALGMLPVQLIGVVLLVASLVFFVLELLHPGVGLPAIAGSCAWSSAASSCSTPRCRACRSRRS